MKMKMKMIKKIINNIKGLSLISLIVGMGLSAFILTVILQVLANSKGYQRLADNVSEMNETLRFGSYILTNIASYTGFRTPPAYGGDFVPVATAFADTGGYFIQVYPDEQNSNTVVLSMQGHDDGQVRDCLGTAIPGGTLARMKFYVASSANGYNFVCDRLDTATNTVLDTVNLIDDIVERVYFRYGWDSTGNGKIDQYIDGAAVTATPAIQLDLHSLQAAVIVRSRQEVRTNPKVQSFDIFDITEAFPNDRYIRKLNMTTVPFYYVE